MLQTAVRARGTHPLRQRGRADRAVDAEAEPQRATDVEGARPRPDQAPDPLIDLTANAGSNLRPGQSLEARQHLFRGDRQAGKIDDATAFHRRGIEPGSMHQILNDDVW